MTGFPDLAAYAAEAQRRLDPAIWAYLARGAGDGLTLDDNEAAWRRLKLRPHVLRGVQSVDASTIVLGQRIALPVIIAPTGRATRFHPLGEAEVLKGAGAAGSLSLLPSSVAQSLEGLAEGGSRTPRWLQFYFDEDRGFMRETAARAKAAGCQALVLTVDLVPPAGGPDAPPPPPPAPWESLDNRRTKPVYAGVSLRDLTWLTDLDVLPVIVKGVLRDDDARACVAAGAKGIVVSNHGGNQLDGTVATAEALEPIVRAVAGGAEVYVDGGVRDGASILRALALGARAVLVGRPTSWGLAADGAAGVEGVLDVLRAELERTMALCGVASVREITRDLVA
jgi:4-hydroxymandelate oxidase